ncbi:MULTISPECIES: hypothetical protein [Francisella]|nr:MULTISPECIES: hypothetical protein [Francisella]
MKKIIYISLACFLALSLNSCWIMAAGVVGGATGAYIAKKD